MLLLSALFLSIPHLSMKHLKKGVSKAELQQRLRGVFQDTDIAMWECRLA